jgi:hypothetical protein
LVYIKYMHTEKYRAWMSAASLTYHYEIVIYDFSFCTHSACLKYAEGPKNMKGSKTYIHKSPPPFYLTLLQFDKVTLTFMWVAPSFERISHYTPYITFRFSFWLLP